ncbi:NACHT, LRR and PYD domains-containing protein 3-like [Colossoma macropomum]|uniref:NACHT, LRR and PYD domains-containing protein 3-like n=1 Tax=Colossoma macropomum TaxID=42526 RepID=UPI00186417C7|nr:NACHT, LRR and PYD domains-containing protein 3-like [Colossoma macropomum]
MANIKFQLLDILQELLSDDLKKFQWHLNNGVEDFKHIPKSLMENADIYDTVDKMVESYSPNGAVEITLQILNKMNQNELAEKLRTNLGERNAGQAMSAKAQPGNSTNIAAQDAWRQAESQNLKLNIIDQYATLYEGTAAKGKHNLLNDIYTELYIVKDWRGGVNTDHEVIQIEARSSRRAATDAAVKFSEVFSGRQHVKKVLTLGIAGIGKTVSVQKFALDWAEGKSNEDIDFVFIIPFRELNLLKDEEYSLPKLLLYFYPEQQLLKETGLFDGECKCVFIFDGLDEFRSPLNFDQKKMSALTKKASVNVLVTNLITGALFPSARVWITSRPAAADQIPLNYIHLVTEVQGFVTDQQKEDYFRNRISKEHEANTISHQDQANTISDQDQANTISDQANDIISLIKESKTLYIMCYIPVFCWLTYTVLQQIMKNRNTEELKSLTQMYTHFLTIQMETKSKKGNTTPQKDPKNLLESNRTVLLKLAELAFKQLMKGNVMFYEEDLRESSIDVTEASVYSGIFTEIFREECVLYQRKVYCFVHLSFQEFLAALYVFHCYEIKNMEELQMFKPLNRKWSKNVSLGFFNPWYGKWSENVHLDDLLEGAVIKAVKSQNGHLDLFLRFLLGISLESNQRLLQGLLTPTQRSSEKITEYIKTLIKGEDINYPISTERSINLFLCLSEMNDQSLSREIQEYLKSDKHSEEKLPPGQCSALACMLLMSEAVLDELDLMKYNTSEEGYRRLIPAVTVCRKARLSGCNLTKDSCETLSSALQSPNSPLKELDLSNNYLQDSGVQLLSAGLKSSHCKLEILRLAGCSLTKDSCEILCSTLQSAKSPLKKIDLSNNDLQDSGVELLSAGLKSSGCTLEILKLVGCNLTKDSCETLCFALQSANSSLKKIDLSNNYLQDSGVQLLSAGLKSSHCKLEILRIPGCNLTKVSCKTLCSALQSANCSLKELHLSDNDLQDSGVQLLSVGLRSSCCKLEILRLSGCMVTNEGCSSLASALKSNPSQLREIDLTYNHPGESGVKLLSDLMEDAHFALDTLRVDHGGKIRMKLGLKKYAVDLTLDPNTANRNLSLSEGNRKVENVMKDRPYPDHPDRFVSCYQVLSVESLTGRCYWEVQWIGFRAVISVSYRGIRRKGQRNDCTFGNNKHSWSLNCFNNRYFKVRHNKQETALPAPPSPSNRVGVYLDWESGTLSFYSVSPDTHTLFHLHTLYTTFTEPLYAGFRVMFGSLNLCKIE